MVFTKITVKDRSNFNSNRGYKVIIYDEEDRQKALDYVRGWSLTKPMELIGRVYKKNRSHAQNAIAAVWYRDRGKQTGHGEHYERCYLKLSYGVPIMMKHKEFAAAWRPYQTQPYEMQFEAMKIVDVTSLMNVEEMTEYLNEVENDSYSEGFSLTKPKMYDEAMNR